MPFNINAEPETLQDCEDQAYYWQLYLKSLEAQTERVDPRSGEFTDLMRMIFDTKDRLADLSRKRSALAAADIESRNNK